MSVLVKDMEMPKDGAYWCEIGVAGEIATITIHGEDRKSFRLIPIPPHGRLIDADELEKKFCSHCDDYMSGKDECKEGCFDLKIIKSMPTVIPADKDGET